jgi:hypothetical protein
MREKVVFDIVQKSSKFFLGIITLAANIMGSEKVFIIRYSFVSKPVGDYFLNATKM